MPDEELSLESMPDGGKSYNHESKSDQELEKAKLTGNIVSDNGRRIVMDNGDTYDFNPITRVFDKVV